jgi:TPR repeat protein
MASFDSKSIMPLPKPSSQEATTIARDDDPGAPAKGEPRTAKSFASERLATLLPGAPGAQDPPSSTAVRPLDAEQIKFLMKHGEQFIAAGDVVTARLAFQRAAEAGDLNAAVALGATYDPTVRAKIGVVGISADVAVARSWYQKAEKLGSPEARRRLEVLADR